MIIESLQNERVKQVVKLRSRKHRDNAGLTIVEGYAALGAALAGNYPIDELYFCRALFLGENEDQLLKNATRSQAKIIECTEGPFRKMAYRDRPDGLLAVAPAVRMRLSGQRAGENAFYLIAERIARPGNLGSILRSADAAGATGVIIVDAATDVFNPEVIRASIGTVFSMPVFEASREEAISWCRENAVAIAAATPHTETLYTEGDLSGPLAVAVGAEQYGLTDEWLAAADVKVRIPMYGHADSLNVATAATLLLYEAGRQRRASGGSGS